MSLKASNKDIYRYMINGGTPEKAGMLSCVFSGQPLEGKVKYALHHYRVEKGRSVNKSDREPFSILNEIDLKLPENRRYLLDLLGTVPVATDVHEKLHKEIAAGSRDIGDLKGDQVPWALRSPSNYAEFCKHVGLDVPYDVVLEHQRNTSRNDDVFKAASRIPTRVASANESSKQRDSNDTARIFGFVGALLIAVFAASLLVTQKATMYAATDGNCPTNAPIKGNINIKGEKFFHRPTDPYYSKTTIDPSHGERCFGSAEEARIAGWRHPTED